tara:strand:+ start:641 stop:1123 length:483 start_codon:yes stop_codon:yes gene_type:complete
MKIIKNFLEPKIFKQMQELVFSSKFPYFYVSRVGSVTDKSDFMFTHILFLDNKQNSEYYNNLVSPILGRLNFNYLWRAKLNCYTKKEKFVYTDLHTDFKEPHTVALFSLNTCNGFTYFEDTKEKVPSIENQVCIFDGNRRHCSVSQTDTDLRINININLQ